MADGTYPRYAFLVSPYESPITTKQRTFNRLQEAVRKDVERLFSVLKARFLVALHLARYGTVEQLATAAQAVATLHTMVVELRRDGSAGRQRAAEIAAAAGATGARNGGSWVEGARNGGSWVADAVGSARAGVDLVGRAPAAWLVKLELPLHPVTIL